MLRWLATAIVTAGVCTACGTGDVSGAGKPAVEHSPVSGGGVASPSSSPRSSSPSSSSSSGRCEVYDSGESVRISVTGSNAGTQCQTLVHSLSVNGDFWTETPQPNQSSDLGVVCVMNNGDLLASIIDSKDAALGRSLCSSFVQSGWTEDTAAEQQQTSASAAASSSQQEEQQANQAVADLNSHGGDAVSVETALKSDLQGLDGDVTSIKSDVKETNTDLQTVQSDSRHGGNSDGTTCDDAGTVADDAGTVSDDAGSMQDDLGSLTNDISTAHDDTSALRSDLATVQSLIPGYSGGANALGPSDVQRVIVSIDKAIASTIRQVNHNVDVVNSQVSKAYSYSSAASKVNDCGTYSSPPASISHLKK